MNKEEEILKAEKLKDKREKALIAAALAYLVAAIAISLFGLHISVVTEVLIPFMVGIAAGLILSLFSIKLDYNTTIRLIGIQSAVDEIKSKSMTLDSELPQEITNSIKNKQTPFWKKTENKLMIISIAVALLIGIPTLILAYQTGLVLDQIKDINEYQSTVQNFQWDMIGNVEPLVIKNRLYNNEFLNQKLSLSIVSPHYLKIEITSVEIQNDDQSKKLPQVYLQEPITRVLPNGVSNIDIDVPIRLNFDPKLSGYDATNGTSSLGEIRYNFEVTNIQTKKPATSGFVHASVIFE